MLAEDVRFDDNSRPSNSDQPVPPGGVLRALRQSAESTGLDPISELYNEALRCATEGHLRMARERLQVLLGLAPDDGQARLLLAKVHVAGQRWQEALGALDEATAAGENVPMDLRRAVEDHLRADLAAEEEQDAAARAREQGEIKALRQEARRLRTENAQLLGRSHDLEKETRKWAWTTTAVAVIGLAFVGANLVISLASPPGASTIAAAPADVVVVAPAVVAPGEVPKPAEEVAPKPKPVPATPQAVADAAKTALANAPELADATLSVTVKGGSATITGEVGTARQKKKAENLLLAVGGISAVDTAGVTILARTKGTEHTVAAGDTLSKVALQYYGEASQAKRIQDANQGTLKGKTDLSIGQKLTIPAIK